MDYDFTPSLISIAATHITIALWYNSAVLTNYERTRKCSTIMMDEHMVAEKVVKLPLPMSLQRRVLSLIRPVGQQINDWVRTNKKFISSFNVDLYKEMCWTACGLIDYAKTAENIIENNDFSPLMAYEFACINGAGSKVCQLWPAARVHIFNQTGEDQMEVGMHEEVRNWTTLLSEKFPTSNVELHSIEKEFFMRGLHRSVANRNEPRAKFYFQSLNYSRQLKFLRELITSPLKEPCVWEWDTTMQLFFLSCMNEKQKEDFFSKYPAETLVIFLEWPLRNFFPNIVEKGVSLLSSDDLLNLSVLTLDRMEYYLFEAELYKELFKDIWQKSPMVLRKACFNELMSKILTALFKPFPIKQALAITFDDDEAEENVKLALFSNIDIMLYFITAKSKRRAFQNIIHKILPSEARRKFSKDVYSSLTQKSRNGS